MKIFDPESKFQGALAIFADLVIVNILALICSLPIVTIGASAKATSEVTARMVREEGSSRVRAFFLAFRKNLGVSLVWGLVMIMAIALVLYEASVIVRAGIEGPVGVLLHAGLLSGLLMLGAISVWLFPILEAPASRMRTNLAQALQLAIVHLPRTLATLAIPIVSTASWLFLPDQRGMLLALSFVCLPALGAYVANLLVQPVLRPHLVQPDR